MPLDDRIARSIALEQAYVHDVYEQFYDNPRSIPWPKVKTFLEDLEPGSIICDVGCGNGKYLSINTSIFNIGGDKSTRLTEVSREKQNEAILLDNMNLPFRDDSIDAVISIAVIHHFATTERRINALRELARVLRIGGRVIISVWAMEQSQRKFESQDVLVPWNRPKHLSTSLELTSATSTSEDDGLLPYHAIHSSDTDSSRSPKSKITIRKRNKGREKHESIFSKKHSSNSSSSLSSPNETCYSFVRRALQKLAGGRRVAMHKPWFLESWTGCSKDIPKRFQGQSCECYDCMENIQDIPIELRRIDDDVRVSQRRKTFPSSKLVNDISGTLKSKSLINIKTVENNNIISTIPSLPSVDEIEIKEPEPSPAAPAKRKLVKQKKSICDEDADEALDQATDMTNLIKNSDYKILNYNNKRGSVLKQRSLNEELMSNRTQEKEKVRQNIQKQASLNEDLIYRRYTFDSFKESILSVSTSKKFQLIKTGFTKKIMNSTNNIEKVTSKSLKNGFAKIFQQWKNGENLSPNSNDNIIDVKIITNADEKTEPLERRSSKEDGSDSSKDSSLQSDTSVDSEDSFASVIFVPKSNPMSPTTTLSPGPPSPRLRTSSVPNSPKIKQSSCPTSPRIKQVPLGLHPLTKQLSSPKPSTTTEHMEKINEKEPKIVLNPERSKTLAQKYRVQQIPAFRKAPEIPKIEIPVEIPKTTITVENKSDEPLSPSNNESVEIRNERLKKIRDLLSQSPGFGAKSSKSNFPLVRHSSVNNGKMEAVAKPLPKLLSLELFNPETDDKDSDSSAVSSPDSVESIVSVKSDSRKPAEENIFTFPTYKNAKQSKLLEAAAGVASSLDNAVAKVIKTSPKVKKRQLKTNEVLAVIQRSYSFETKPLLANEDSNDDCHYHLKDFAEKLSEKLLREIDQYQEKTKLHLSNTPLENIDDPYIHRLNNELDDLSKLSAEIKKQNEYLAKLSASDSLFNKCPICKKNDCTNHFQNRTRRCAKKKSDEKVQEKCRIELVTPTNSDVKNLDADKDTKKNCEENVKVGSKEYIKLGTSLDSGDSDKGSSTNSMLSSAATSINFGPSLESADYSERTSGDSQTNSLSRCSTASVRSENCSKFDNLKQQVSSNSSLDSNRRDKKTGLYSDTSQDSLPSDDMGGEITYHRYYHVFREGELDQLIEKYVDNLHIISSYYDHASWCIVAEKVQVWTI